MKRILFDESLNSLLTLSRSIRITVHHYSTYAASFQCLGNNPQEEAAMRGLLGADRLIACGPDELHLKLGNVLQAFRPVGV
jgi:hypothetical protein